MLIVECDRCHRPVAEVAADGTVTAASGGSVRDESTDRARRYRLACTARRHPPEVRVFTEATLHAAAGYRRRVDPRPKAGLRRLNPPRVGMRAVAARARRPRSVRADGTFTVSG